MWGARSQETQIEHTQVNFFFQIFKKTEIKLYFLKIFERTENGLKLVKIDEEQKQGFGPKVMQRIIRSSWFNMTMLLLVLANAVVTATIKFTHKDSIDKRTLIFYKRIEVKITKNG